LALRQEGRIAIAESGCNKLAASDLHAAFHDASQTSRNEVFLRSTAEPTRVSPESAELLTHFLANREAIRRFLAARVGMAQEADDLLQELFLKISRFEPTEEVKNPASYLFRTAMNLAHDRRRERQRAASRDAKWTDSRHTILGTEAVDDAPSAEAAYGARQRLAAVYKALDELSPQCRRVFVLHKLEGLPHQQVADRLGISRSTVEKHMHTALKHLIARLERC
jgi:RNA polymerase sigma-70 factor (ECF subfamily)